MMRRRLRELDFMEAQIREIEAQLNHIGRQDARVALLRTIPGVGPRTAEAVAAFADEIKRFKDRKRFAAYFGLVPTLDASADVVRRGHITKHGPSVVRWVLAEATHQAIRRSPAFARVFARMHRGVRERYKKAVVGVARKLVTVMFAMLRDARPYDEAKILRAA